MPKSGEEPKLLLLSGAILASSSLVQIVPVFEGRHIWWSTAPLIGVAIAGLLMMAQRAGRRLVTGALCLAFMPLVIASGSGYADRLSGPWVPIGGGPFLEGMRVRPALARDLGPMVHALDEQRERHRNVVILALGFNLLWGLVGDRSDPADRYSVSYKLVPDAPAIARFIKQERPVIWLDQVSPDLASAYARSLRYCVVRSQAADPEFVGPSAVLRPCPGPDRSKPIGWKATDGPAPAWAEKIT